jgi:hypothetical protein
MNPHMKNRLASSESAERYVPLPDGREEFPPSSGIFIAGTLYSSLAVGAGFPVRAREFYIV